MKSFKEALKGNQHKLDKNKNGKLDSHDFKLLRKEEEEVEEADDIQEATPNRQQVKQGIGIARDKRYASGNMTGAVKAMDKLNKGLAQHPAVKKELQKQNEEVEELDEATPTSKQVKQGIGIARDKRYASGNMTGAVKAMDKINRGLAQHPVVKKELQKQNEEVEELDELSKSTLASYAKKATHDARIKQTIGKDFEADRSRKPDMKAAAKELADKYKSKSRSREAGVGKAIDRLAKEEVELDEKMNMAKADMGDVIKDFQKSDAPQFAGKSAEKRRQMAIAAKLQADREKNESMSFAAYMKLEETAEVELIELDEMISYTDFQGKIDAHKKAGNKVVDSKYSNDKAHYTVVDKEGTARKVIHTARGTQMQNLGNVKGDDSDESPSGEKRGRGRPKGSKSGASGPRIK